MIGLRHPMALTLLIPLAAIIALFMWSKWRRRRELQALSDLRLLPSLVRLDALKRRRNKDRLLIAAALLLVLAAAGPQFGTRLKEVRQRGVDVFIAIDTSRSMLAEDVPPSRLERARRSLSLLVNKLEGNRVGVIAFAKRAVMQCPLTVDTEAARLLLETVNPNTVPEQGTAVGSAIRLALSRFPQQTRSGRAIVVLTDGEDHQSDPIGAAREAKEQGVVVFTIGIGTSKGEVIKNRDAEGKVTEFHKHKGEMVVTRLDDALLTKVAEITGGAYYRASSTDHEIDEIADVLNGFEKRELTTKVFERLQERFVPFALLALVLLILEFFLAETPGQRRRVIAGVRRIRVRNGVTAVILVALFCGPAFADVRGHLRAGNKLFKKGDLPAAAKEFESAQIDDPENPALAFNLGTVAYIQGDNEEALRHFNRAEALARNPAMKARIAYNAGHLLFQMGRPAESVEKFKESLRLNPGDVDAKYNIEYIRSGKQPKPQGGGQQEQNPKDEKAGPSPEAGESPQQQPAAAQQRKPGDLTKEDAERILQMAQDEESEKLKTRPIRPLGSAEENKDMGGEDW